MGKGGGGGGSSTQTVKYDIPQWMEDAGQSNYQQAQQVAGLPYQPYSGQGVAPMNGSQNLGIGMVQQAAQNNYGGQAIRQGIQGAGAGMAYQPQQVSAQSQTPDALAGYMSPYTKDVTDATMSELDRQRQIQLQNNGGAATNAGAFGGARQGVMDAETNRNAQQVQAQTLASLNNSAYSNAQNQFNNDANRNLTAQQSNQAAGLSGAGLNLQGAGLLGTLGAGYQQNELNNGNAVLQTGNQQQQQAQNQNNWDYQQFQDQRGYPQQQLGILEQALGMTPNMGGSTTTPMYQNSGSSALGGALGGGLVTSMFTNNGMYQGLGAGLGGLMGYFSDEDLKTDKAPVDTEAIADKVRDTRMDSWRYKPNLGIGGGKHVGMYAQDFAKNFGGDGHMIPYMDAIGVNMAATKGLAQKLQRLERQVSK
ncbi:tail fiber domain-containing protein [Bordetella flabilis]|uniref:Peptidase S74 domain-containing protein n=1 Tax=Bordetella flabilis TaxID=463014 RepID=A0A193GAF5_9BORD|nr:tail fiber domain-containing protein [Bordetella flabilis]ANN76815.1 hypothetical protein BAU07_06530 [Bordetella flabilis]